MSVEDNKATAAAAMEGLDIASVLRSAGPVVKCVVLRAPKGENGDNGDAKNSVPPPTSDDDNNNDDNPKPRVVLESLIDEVEIDTTPSKSMVSKELGGPFTFLGQYEDEGIVLMVRNLPEELLEKEDSGDFLHGKKLSELRALCGELEIDMTGMLEMSDVLKAIEAHIPPLNPHALQPPLHKAVVRGDIIAIRVAETKEELDNSDNDENDEGAAAAAAAKLEVPTNEEFFLDYTKDEYLKFASRTDIEEHEVYIAEEEAGSEEQEDQGEDEEDDDGEAVEPDETDDSDDDGLVLLGGDESIEEEDKSAMFNLVMNEVLRQYREENGRGPNTEELLELRATIAKELDVEVAHVEESDWDKKAKEICTGKKIRFHEEDKVLEFHPHENEHNHHYLPMDDGDDDEHDEEDDEDGDESYEPPTKRLKTSADGEDNDEDDAKPAARETEDTKSAAAENGDKATENGDTSKEATPEEAEDRTAEESASRTSDNQ